MIKLIGRYDIPEWAICYLVNGDLDGLTDEEVQEIDEFWQSLLDEYHTSSIVFDTEVMNEEKYSTFFRNEIDQYPAFGRKFGACATWRLPVYVGTSDDNDTEVNIVITGNNPLKDNKFEIIVIQNKSFCDLDEADIWVNTYFDFLNSFDYQICETKDSIINIQ